MIIELEMATLHCRSTHKDSVITYILYSSSWIHGAVHVEESVEYHSHHRMDILNVGTCIMRRVITY